MIPVEASLVDVLGRARKEAVAAVDAEERGRAEGGARKVPSGCSRL